MKIVWIISVALVFLTQTSLSRPPSLCTKPADIVFVLDTSTSIWTEDFTQMMTFVRDVVDMFDVGLAPSQTRIGIVKFSTSYHLEFRLNAYSTKDEVLRAILNTKQIRGNTNTSVALDFTAHEMFTSSGGSRHDVAHIAIVVTDGQSQDGRATKRAAKNARDAGVQIFAVGVGKNVVTEELNNIASDPDDNFVFNVSDFGALNSIKRELADRTCEVSTALPLSSSTTTMTPTTISTTACGGKPADVYFLLDSSASINISDFNHEVLGFVRNISRIFDIGVNKTRIGVLTFSDSPKTVIGLNDYTSLAQLQAAINPQKIPFIAGGTNTAAAISHVRNYGFAAEVARPEVAHVMIIITDGRSRNRTKTVAEAEAAKKSGIYVFAVGVGSAVDKKEIMAVASEPHEDFVFSVTDFQALASIKNLLAIRTCKLLPRDDPGTSQNSECKLTNSKVMFVFDSFAMGLPATRPVTSSLVNVMTSLTKRTNDVFVGMKIQSCWSYDIPLDEGASLLKAMEEQKKMLHPKLDNLMQDVRRKSLVKRGDLNNGRRVMVVLLDKENIGSRLSDIRKEAQRAKFIGVEVFVVITDFMDSNVAYGIASNPVKDHTIVVPDFYHLGKITSRLCGDEHEIYLPPVIPQ